MVLDAGETPGNTAVHRGLWNLTRLYFHTISISRKHEGGAETCETFFDNDE